MKSQLLLIFLPFILLIGFLVGNLALSLMNQAAEGQGNNGRQYFSYVNQQGKFYTENVLFFNEMLAPDHEAIIASMSWANQVVHIRTEELTPWTNRIAYDYGNKVGFNGANYAIRWFYPRPQPPPPTTSCEYDQACNFALNQTYRNWLPVFFREFEFGVWYAFDEIVKSDGNYYRRKRTAGTNPGGFPSTPPFEGLSGQGLANAAINWEGVNIQEIPLYTNTTPYYTAYTRAEDSYVRNQLTGGPPPTYSDYYYFLEYYGSIVRHGGFWWTLIRSVPDVTTAPVANQLPDPLVNQDIWITEPTYTHLMDPRIPTDGNFFTIINSPFSPAGSKVGIRWDRLVAIVPWVNPPNRIGSPYSNASLDFEVVLNVGQGVTIMNSAVRMPFPSGNNALGQFLNDEYNTFDRRWQIVRFHAP